MAQKQGEIAYEAWNLSFDGTNYIDTGVYLFTQENINRDFEFIAEGIYGAKNTSKTALCTKHDGNAYGFLVRCGTSTDTTYKGTIWVLNNTPQTKVIVKRINGVLQLSGDYITNPGVGFINNVFAWSLHLGCAVDNSGNPYRYWTGTIDHIVVRWL